jgi:predicted transcriptional regulator
MSLSPRLEPCPVNPLVRHIERERRRQDISQMALSVCAGYSRDYWGQVERGHVNPSLQAVADHAEVLGFKVVLFR